MERFVVFTIVVLSLTVLSGCGRESEETLADRELEAAGASYQAAEATAPETSEGEAKTSAAETTGLEPRPTVTEGDLRAALKAANPDFDGQLVAQSDGRNIFMVALSDPAIEDVNPLAGLPLQRLELLECHVTDISPLEGMPLRVLGLERTDVRDISALKGMPLVELSLSHTMVEDLSPLKGAPLQKLYLVNTKVTDLSPLSESRLEMLWLNETPVSDITPLAKLPLVSLTLAGTKVSDVSPLKGHPIQRLHIARSEVTDLSPLEWMQLTRLVFTPSKIQSGIQYARNMRSIREIGTEFGDPSRPDNMMPPYVFWERYDAGQFK